MSQALFLAVLLGGSVTGLLAWQALPVLLVMGLDPSDQDLLSLALGFLYIRYEVQTSASGCLLSRSDFSYVSAFDMDFSPRQVMFIFTT